LREQSERVSRARLAPASSRRVEAGRPSGAFLSPTVGSGACGSSIHGEFLSSSDKILLGGGWRHRLLVKRLLGITCCVDDR